MATIPASHRAEGPASVGAAVITVSDTRTLESDTGGAKVVACLQAVGHRVVAREIVRDEAELICQLIRELCGRDDVDVVLLTGGTGLSSRDCTYEAVNSLLTKVLPGYGELFRWLSYEDIGPAAMLSRTIGGLVGRTCVLAMPGSPAAVELAMTRLILPELPHLVGQARR